MRGFLLPLNIDVNVLRLRATHETRRFIRRICVHTAQNVEIFMTLSFLTLVNAAFEFRVLLANEVHSPPHI